MRELNYKCLLFSSTGAGHWGHSYPFRSINRDEKLMEKKVRVGYYRSLKPANLDKRGDRSLYPVGRDDEAVALLYKRFYGYYGYGADTDN